MKINTILLAITLLLFVGAGCSISTTAPIATSDDELLETLREPLVGTIMFQPSTIHATFVDSSYSRYGKNKKSVDQQMVHTFYGHYTELPYTVFIKRISWCKGNEEAAEHWELLTSPKCKDTVISLRTYIVQMIYAKNQNDPLKTDKATWSTGDYIWNVSSKDKDGYQLIDISSSSNKRWKVRVKT